MVLLINLLSQFSIWFFYCAYLFFELFFFADNFLFQLSLNLWLDETLLSLTFFWCLLSKGLLRIIIVLYVLDRCIKCQVHCISRSLFWFLNNRRLLRFVFNIDENFEGLFYFIDLLLFRFLWWFYHFFFYLWDNFWLFLFFLYKFHKALLFVKDHGRELFNSEIGLSLFFLRRLNLLCLCPFHHEPLLRRRQNWLI